MAQLMLIWSNGDICEVPGSFYHIYIYIYIYISNRTKIRNAELVKTEVFPTCFSDELLQGNISDYKFYRCPLELDDKILKFSLRQFRVGFERNKVALS